MSELIKKKQIDDIKVSDLIDTPSSYVGQSGNVLVVNGAEDGFDFGSSGVSTFLDLIDTPADYIGQSGKVVRVTSGEDGLEFIGEDHIHVQDFQSVISNGQTVFTLSNTPYDDNDVVMYVNGQLYIRGINYTVSGITVTWLDTPFILDTDDEVSFEYQTQGAGGLHNHVVETLTISSNGQTAFTLGSTPAWDSAVAVFINGQKYKAGTSYSVSGTSLTWLDVPFTLDTTDDFVVAYQFVV